MRSLFADVALAGVRFQARAIHNTKRAALEIDKPRALKMTGDDRHRGTPDAKRRREKVVGDLKVVAANTVVRRQEPSAQPLLNRMKRSAARNINCRGLYVAIPRVP